MRTKFSNFYLKNILYDTGNPIPYSGMLLRDKLTAAVERMDTKGRIIAFARWWWSDIVRAG